MPFRSRAQQRFMFSQHPEMAKEWADKTPDISALPEHVKKMADGGTSDDKFYPEVGQGITDGINHDLNMVKAALSSAAPSNVTTAGNPSDIDPSVKDATTSDFLLPYLLGPSAKGMAEDLPTALKDLGETGEITIGRAAPKMEEAAEAASPKVEAFIKGVQKSPNGNEVKIWGVRGDPDEIAKLGYGSDPGSVPEHILREKGILPEQINADQSAPNAYADGGIVDKLKSDKTNAQKADDIDPIITSPTTSTDTPKGYAGGGYPHVTFMEDQTPEQNKETTHLAKSHEEPKMAKGGVLKKTKDRNAEPAKPKDIEMSHEMKLNSIYKAMGIKKYADGGTPDVGDVDASQLPNGVPPPPPSGPGLMEWLQNFGSKLVNSPAGQIAGAAMNPVSAIADAVKGVAPTILNAEGPAVSSAANIITGGAVPAMAPTPSPVNAAPAIPAAPPMAPPVSPQVPVAPAMRPVVAPASGGSNLNTLFNQDTSKLTQGVNPEDRQALANNLQGQQHGIGSVIAEAVAGLGDALAAKGGREQHSLQGIFSMQKQQRDEALANFDKARQDRVQKLALQTQIGQNAIQQLAAQDAYGTDEHLNKMLGAPAGTAHKDLPLYFQAKSAAVAQQEKDADLYMKAHAQASTDVDNAVKNSSVLGIKPSSAQLQASGAKLADQYFNRAKGNVLVKPSDGGQAQWIPAQNIGKAKQMDPNLQIQG